MLIPEELFELASKIAEEGYFFPSFEVWFYPVPDFTINMSDGNDFDEIHYGIEGAKEFLEEFLE